MALVESFTHLKGRPKEHEALPLLQRIASLVKPIMRKHAWRLPVLAEFFPENESLMGLNVNMGQKILLRLRPPWAPDTFYDDEQLVLVMLHELSHNVHGPHDSKFYALLSELEQEYDDLKRSGYAGEGFHSEGARLGAGVSHDLPPHLAKIKALQAAERRRKTASVLGSGGRLGGRTTGRSKSPRELAAEAAERRARDEKSCGAGHGINAEIEAQRAMQDSVIDRIGVDALREASPETIIIDGPSKLADVDATERVQRNRNITAGPPTVSRSSRPSSAIKTETRSKLPIQPHFSNDWSCPMCTLLNPALALQCSACLASRPADPATGWICLSCGEQGMPHEFWSCRFCGQVKRES
ncbi:WLM domain-containing protein [Gautieria morchelliformis]|nr:WLM domain-containing protein [Gautieria morchelliformis]